MNLVLLPMLALLGLAAGWTTKWLNARLKLSISEKIARRRAQETSREAHSLSEKILREGHSQMDQERELFMEEEQQQRRESDRRQGQTQQKQQTINNRENVFNRFRQNVAARERGIQEHENSNEALKQEARLGVQKRSGTTTHAIKQQLIDAMVIEEKRDAQHVIRRMEEEAERKADLKARQILVSTMESLPLPHIIEHSSTNLEAPNREMIERLISREGRYIRILESLLGVELYVADTPEEFNLSSPDPIKRETAKATLDRLFRENRLNPARIEETVQRVTNEINETIRKEARRLLNELGIRNFRKEATIALGRLLYRYSYGQNQFYHAKEVALLSSMLARELGADPQIAKRAGLLHDIGKGFALAEKAHGELGAELAEQWGEDVRVINAIASHHDDTEQEYVEAVIVQIADAISGARPGARRETISNYLERVEQLETLAEEFDGVDKAFAIYAGRELRIVANSDRVNDEKAGHLAFDIARKIEENLTYPGRIKITVIREMKVSSYTH